MRSISWLLSLLLLAGAAPLAHAAVFDRDWQVPGDGLLTFDNVNNREWLDLSETLLLNFPPDYHYDDVVAELSPGGMFEGFVVAKREDVNALAESAGIVLGTLDFDTNQLATGHLIDLLSPTVGSPISEGSLGSYVVGFIDEVGTTPYGLARSTAFLQFRANTMRAGLQVELGAGGDFIRIASTGVMLYRQAVPEPSSVVLGCAGALLLSMCLIRNR